MANEIIDLQNEFVYKGQRYRLPGSGGGSSEPGQPGADGINPHIDVPSGHWFVGDEDTGVNAQGPQGNSGVASADGVVVINNTDDGGYIIEEVVEGQTITKVAVLSAEAGKKLALKSIPGVGTFADAYEKARANNVVFPWFLRDVDENGNPIEKMIWHNGYRKFVDAIGAEVEGQRNGLTIKVNENGYLQVGDGELQSLSRGVNNFSFDDLGWDGTSAINQSKFKVFESDEITANGNYAEEIDFGGLKIRIGDNFLKDWDSLKKVKRLHVELYIVADSLLNNCGELVEAQIKGTIAAGTNGVSKTPMLTNCPKLEKADLKDFSVAITRQGTRQPMFYSICGSCPRLKYADIRNIDTSGAEVFGNVFGGAESLKTLIIGNLSNAGISAKPTSFVGVRNCVLICTSSNPPTLNTDYDWITTTETIGGVEQDICHFSAIYVPNAAAETAYKENEYNGSGTGWSKYADLIHDITGTEYEDLI